MTVESTQSRIDVVAADGQTDFQFSFKYFEATDISVFVDEVEQTMGFTVTPSVQGVNFGGTVVFATGRTTGEQIAIVRILDITQESDYEEGDRLPSAQLEDDLDRSTMINQQQQEALERRPALLESSLITNVTIADPTAEVVGHAFVWRQNPDDTFFIATSDENIDDALQNIEATLTQAQEAADTATDQAGIATTQAGIATNAASSAATSETNAAASAQEAQDVASSVNFPAGLISYFAETSVPTGWLYCNGQAVDRTVYDALFTRIGTRYGSGDGSTSFNVPDLRNEFLRGYDDRTAGTRAIGTHQDDAAPNITGNIGAGTDRNAWYLHALNPDGIESGNVGGAFSITGTDIADVDGGSNDGADGTVSVDFDASRSSTVYSDTATEIRPDNTVLLPCIRAFGAVNQDTVDADTIVATLNELEQDIITQGDTQVARLEAATSDTIFGSLPVGTILPTSGMQLADGFVWARGGTFLRDTYPEFWAWVQLQGSKFITESVWQAKSTAAASGAVPYYSDGDGSTTFRVPRLVDFLRGVDDSTARDSVLDGAPNITGESPSSIGGQERNTVSGAFAESSTTSARTSPGTIGTFTRQFDIDASRSSAAYGRSTEVQPRHFHAPYMIKAASAAANGGIVDALTLQTQIVQNADDIANLVSTLDSDNFLHMTDDRSAGVAGGVISPNAFRVRVLNTVKTNTILGASLDVSNAEITLPSGTYFAETQALAYKCSNHLSLLNNNTTNVVISYGSSEASNNGDFTPTTSNISTLFTLTEESIITLQHRVAASDGGGSIAGLASGFGTERYAQVKIWKVG